MQKKILYSVFLLYGFCFLMYGQEPSTPKEQEKMEKDPIAETQTYIQKQMEEKPIDKNNPMWRTKLPKFKPLNFDDEKTYFWVLKTNKGEIKIKFFQKTAPNHVANFIYLTELKYFDGLKFHRVIPGFMAQGGCPLGAGNGSPGYKFDGEFDSQIKHDRPGILSMANAGPGTDGSQFFITFVRTPHLDGKHTVFGVVVEGTETVKALESQGTPGRGTPKQPLLIGSASILVE